MPPEFSNQAWSKVRGMLKRACRRPRRRRIVDLTEAVIADSMVDLIPAGKAGLARAKGSARGGRQEREARTGQAPRTNSVGQGTRLQHQLCEPRGGESERQDAVSSKTGKSQSARTSIALD
jgi:hypothetical protein